MFCSTAFTTVLYAIALTSQIGSLPNEVDATHIKVIVIGPGGEHLPGATIRIEGQTEPVTTDPKGEAILPLRNQRYPVDIDVPYNNYRGKRDYIPSEKQIVNINTNQPLPPPSECPNIHENACKQVWETCVRNGIQYRVCKMICETRATLPVNSCEEEIEPICNTCNKCSIKDSPIYRYFSNQRCNLPPWQQPPIGY
jgi:hypothetical protein